MARVRLAGLACAALLALALAPGLGGQTLTRAQQFEGPVDYAVAVSSMRTGDNTAPCAVAATTSATLAGIPAGSTVLGAYLYWAGSGPPDNTVTLGGSGIAAGASWTRTYDRTYAFFGARADVTGRVPGNGTYTLANLSVNTGAPYCAAEAVLKGWALIVVYRNDAALPLKRVEIWDGLDLLMNGASSVTVTPFVASTAHPSRISVLTWEGDRTLSTGEAITFNGSTLPFSPAGNIFYSTSGWGADLLTADVTGAMTGETETGTVGYGTGGDLVLVHALVTSLAIQSVYVTPRTAVSRLPGGYSQRFVVRNTSLLNDQFDLMPSLSGAAGVVRIDSVVGGGFPGGPWSGAGVRVAIPMRDSVACDVWYTVLPPATAAANRIHLLARSVAYAGTPEGSSAGWVDVSRIPPASNLTLTKTATSPPFDYGAPEAFTITVTNSGTTPTWGDIVVTDTLPAGVDFLSGAGAGWSYDTARAATRQVVTATYTGPALAATGGTSSLTLSARVLSPPGSITNRAWVAGGGDTTPASGSASVTVNAAPDLALTKTGPASFTQGTNGRFTLTVTNTGQSRTGFTRLVVTDTLPAGMSYVSSDQGDFNTVTVTGGVVSATRWGVLAAGASLSFTVTVLPGLAAVPSVTNRAVLVARAGVEFNLANNTAEVSTPVIGLVDLTVAKAALGAFRAGANAAYSLTVANNGIGPTSAAALVTDTLPPGLTFVSATGAGWTAAAVGQVVTATFAGAIPAAGQAALTLTVAVDGAAAPAVRNRAWVAGGGEWNLGNDGSGDVVTPVAGFPAITMAIAAAPAGPVQPATDITYQITFLNGGGTDAVNVVVTDTVPPQVQFKLGSEQHTLPAGVTATVQYFGAGAWTYTPVSAGCGAPAGYDACVTRVRWLLQAALAPAAQGTAWLTARAR